jgi:hypothetical protein
MLDVKTTGMRELLTSLDRVSKSLPVEVYIALGKAGAKTQKTVVKEVGTELNIKQQRIRTGTSLKKYKEIPEVRVVLKKEGRIPLKEFGITHDKSKGGGVLAKISKTRGRKMYRPGFIIDKFGGHAFTRPNNGRKVAKLFGPSPWGIMVKNPEKIRAVRFTATDEVKKQMAERIRFLKLKKSGKLNWQ